MSRTSDMLRIQFAASDDIRDAGLAAPEDVVRYDDIAYGEVVKLCNDEECGFFHRFL